METFVVATRYRASRPRRAQGVSARKVMESYEIWFGEDRVAMLRIWLHLTTGGRKGTWRPLKTPAIPGLSEALTDWPDPVANDPCQIRKG